ncbi:MotA/TolQ/ExbB proton channel family protein [Desulfohalovibrio reitneri]|uniref:MotA/TolQ/ExbB proton channel family protein n=1 Tax=Desulfohalovibrio reitneri TaxID=1307759 RepID=UPI0005521F40|nr:MotA/TolQ/ExbB proton channel family protein [Desulfohalovibrio reitneri]
MQDLFLTVFTEGSPIIQGVLILLLFMSVLSWAVIIYKLVTLSRAKSRSTVDYEAFQQAGDLSSAMRSMNPASPVREVGYFALRELKRLEKLEFEASVKGKLATDNVRRALRQGVSFELGRKGASLSVLSTCANVAPFLGLFGTVWGIMRSFQAIGIQKTASLAVVGPGIAEALTTTAIGLAVAVPAAIAYNAFLGMLGNLETVLVNFSSAFLNRMQRELAWIAND